MARKNVSQKVVSVAYGGLIGKLFDETTETLPGYTPVVQPPPPPAVASAAGSSSAPSVAAAAAAIPNPALGPGVVLSGDPEDTEPPYVQILGSDPVMLQEGDSYLDLGAVAADNGKTENVTLNLYLNGAKQERIYIRSAQAGEWIITYEAVDKAGNIQRVTRKIIVIEAPSQPVQNAAAAAAAAAAVTQEPEPAPAPEPEETAEPEPTPEPVPEESSATSTPPTTTTTTTTSDTTTTTDDTATSTTP